MSTICAPAEVAVSGFSNLLSACLGPRDAPLWSACVMRRILALMIQQGLTAFWLCLQARQDFNQVKDIAGQAGRKFSNLAQNFIKDLQGGY